MLYTLSTYTDVYTKSCQLISINLDSYTQYSEVDMNPFYRERKPKSIPIPAQAPIPLISFPGPFIFKESDIAYFSRLVLQISRMMLVYLGTTCYENLSEWNHDVQ